MITITRAGIVGVPREPVGESAAKAPGDIAAAININLTPNKRIRKRGEKKFFTAGVARGGQQGVERNDNVFMPSDFQGKRTTELLADHPNLTQKATDAFVSANADSFRGE